MNSKNGKRGKLKKGIGKLVNIVFMHFFLFVYLAYCSRGKSISISNILDYPTTPVSVEEDDLDNAIANVVAGRKASMHSEARCIARLPDLVTNGIPRN